MKHNQQPLPLWNPYAAGLALGLVLFGSLFLTGSGLGGSGGLARVMALGVDQVAPRTTNRNVYLVGMAGGTQNPLDHRMVWMLPSVLAGGCVSGWTAGRLRIETCRPPHVRRELRWILTLAGGALMGWGAAMAR